MKKLFIILVFIDSLAASAQNTKPVTKPDTIKTYMNSGATKKNVLANDIDAQGDVKKLTKIVIAAIPYAITSTHTIIVPLFGKMVVSLNGDVEYTPQYDFVGDGPVITYTVNDGKAGAGTTGKIVVKVKPLPDSTSVVRFNQCVTDVVVYKDSCKAEGYYYASIHTSHEVDGELKLVSYYGQVLQRNDYGVPYYYLSDSTIKNRYAILPLDKTIYDYIIAHGCKQ